MKACFHLRPNSLGGRDLGSIPRINIARIPGTLTDPQNNLGLTNAQKFTGGEALSVVITTRNDDQRSGIHRINKPISIVDTPKQKPDRFSRRGSGLPTPSKFSSSHDDQGVDSFQRLFILAMHQDHKRGHSCLRLFSRWLTGDKEHYVVRDRYKNFSF